MSTHTRLLGWTALFCVAATTTGCNDSADHIQVQHILIAFKGTIPKPTVTRSKEDAEKLANDLYAQAQKPDAKFDDMVKNNTDDAAPGIYGMSNSGVSPASGEYPRNQMVPAFGDVGFKLKVGEVGLAPYDKEKSPFGYHIIKRVK
jgi:parvulin-like peptidyl-prolyl isomerase